MLTGFMFGLPALYAVVWIALLVRGRPAGHLVSLTMCLTTYAVGYWAIGQSRASTSGIGLLFLPGLAAFSGMLALLSGLVRQRARQASHLAAGWLCLLASVGLVGWLAVDGIQERAKNDERDRRQTENLRAIEQNRARIVRLILEHPGTESAALDAEIEKHRNDRAFLIPALESSFISQNTLDRLASSGDLGVVLAVSRNPRARPDTLERIYHTSSYPPYFFQALARNPSTPRDILDKIAGSAGSPVLRNPLENAVSSTKEASRPALAPQEIERYRGIADRIFRRIVALKERYPHLRTIESDARRDEAGDKLWITYRYTHGMSMAPNPDYVPGKKSNPEAKRFSEDGIEMELYFFEGPWTGQATALPLSIGEMHVIAIIQGRETRALGTLRAAVAGIIRDAQASYRGHPER